MANKQKFDETIVIQRQGEKGKYLQLQCDLIKPGYKKSDGTMTPDVLLKKYSFINVVSEPTDEDVIVAGNKSDAAGAFMEKRKANWGRYLGPKANTLLNEFQVQPEKEEK